MELNFIKTYLLDKKKKSVTCRHDHSNIKYLEPSDRHLGCDVLHCSECGVEFVDLSPKDDEWWNNLAEDAYSAILTLKYMANEAEIPIDGLGHLAEEVKYLLQTGRPVINEIFNERINTNQMVDTFNSSVMPSKEFPPHIKMGF